MNQFEDVKQYFKTPLQEFVFYDKYSRYRYDLGRRETWSETVDRAVKYLKKLSDYKLPLSIYQKIHQYILEMKVMPSMRLLAMAGDAADRTNICLYNCSFVGVDSIDAFVEALLISMAGCGVGFSVEKKYVNELPFVPRYYYYHTNKHVIEDSTEGWAEALRLHLNGLFGVGTGYDIGEVIQFDYSQIRPAGSVLKIKGGRASGPEPLKETMDFITSIFHEAQGRQLRSIEVHDIMCSIGQCAVAGGVRRTAMISLFDSSSTRMMMAKSGKYNNYRWNANNSVVWPEKGINRDQFDNFFDTMYAGMTGEPGIFNIKAIRENAPERRKSELIDGVNPCGEIALRNMQFCNLTSVICRQDDTLTSLIEKVYVASIIGTIQSMATNFPGLRPQYKLNCEEERLLGVDLNGQMDCPLLYNDISGVIREQLRDVAVLSNKETANNLGINPSTAVTCVKPNGNSSQLLDCSSGMHPRFSKFYIRNVRVGVNSPVYKVLFASGVPLIPENDQTWENMTTAIASFPVKSPDSAITRDGLTAIDLLEFWKLNKIHYTEHNPSTTIYYKENEKDIVKEWVWNNKDIIGGITLLPYSDAKFNNMPYIEIDEELYTVLMNKFPAYIKWELLEQFETEDMTTSSQELACGGKTSCEIL